MKKIIIFTFFMSFVLGCTSEDSGSESSTTCEWHYDNIALEDELFDSDLNSLTILSDGTLLAASNMVSSSYGPYDGYLARSIDQGKTWSVVNKVDSYSEAKMNKVITTTSGDAIAVGHGRDGSGWDWFVKRSQDSGVSWTFLESEYSYQSGYYAEPHDAAVSPVAGDLYVVGGAADLAGLRWIVRYAPSTNDSFTGLPDNYQLVLGRDAQARSIAIDADGNIYVGGKAEDSSSKYHWIIRKSEDRGFSWTTIDDFQLSSSGHAEVYDLHIAKDGSVYAAGYGKDSSGFSHWIVRRSINGISFETVDNFLNPNPTVAHNNIAYSIAEDSQGVIYITGQEHDDNESSNYGYMVLKRSTDSGETWEKFDNYLNGSSSGQTGRSVVIDTNDNIFYGGSVGYSRHSVKRRVCITEGLR